MNNTKQKIESLRAEIARLEKQSAVKCHKKIEALFKAYGFDGYRDLIESLPKNIKWLDGRIQSAPDGQADSKTKRRRAKVTAAMRKKVKALDAQGLPIAKIASKLHISDSTVNHIKKALGLVKPRKKGGGRKPKAAVAAAAS